MQIKQIMVTDVISVSPHDSVLAVSELIFKNRFHAVPVVENEKVVGIITEDDFFLKDYDDLFLPAYMKFLESHHATADLSSEMKEKVGKLLSAKASDIMTPDCTTVSPEMETTELMELIKKTKFTTFPVADGEKNILGIVTLSDILGTVRKGSREMEESLKKEGAGEIGKLAKELHSNWSDNMVLISKKRVRTWQGGFLVITLAVVAGFIFLLMHAQNRTACEMEQAESVAIECQKFTYSDWSQCRADGTQIRSVAERFPAGCEGGKTEKLVRNCQ